MNNDNTTYNHTTKTPTYLVSDSPPNGLNTYSPKGGVVYVEYVEVFLLPSDLQLHSLPVWHPSGPLDYGSLQTSKHDPSGYISYRYFGRYALKIKTSVARQQNGILTVACLLELPNDFKREAEHVVYKREIEPLVTEIYDTLLTVATAPDNRVRQSEFYAQGIMNVIEMFGLPKDSAIDAFLHQAPFKTDSTMAKKRSEIARRHSATCTLTEKLAGLKSIYSAVAPPGTHDFNMSFSHLYPN